jgi:hypothetical protein
VSLVGLSGHRSSHSPGHTGVDNCWVMVGMLWLCRLGRCCLAALFPVGMALWSINGRLLLFNYAGNCFPACKPWHPVVATVAAPARLSTAPTLLGVKFWQPSIVVAQPEVMADIDRGNAVARQNWPSWVLFR